MSTFFISDLHLNHANIIKYCKRPFKDVNEMNKTIVERWNSVVKKGDTVFHLGDFCKRGNPNDFLNQMNGRKIFIKGNHDEELTKYNIRPVANHFVYRHNAEDIMLIHSTDWLPFPWSGAWIISGHHHNNNLELFPLINDWNKTINVSAEMVDYTPIEVGKLLDMREKNGL
jgi:calcineurin-like phosphoesterase family protein